MHRSLFTLLATAAIAAGLTVALRASQDPLYTLKVDVPVVSIDVSVTDESGRAVNDLTADAFEVFENGVAQRIEYFSPVSSPYNVFLLFDRSGSTEDQWPFMLRAAVNLLGTLRPQDRLELGAFDAELDVQSQWDDSADKLISAFKELVRPKAIGETDFYRSIENVVRRQFKNVTGRRDVVVLTDGRDTSVYREVLAFNRVIDANQDKNFQGILKTLRGQHIPIYLIALNTDKNFQPATVGADEYRNLQKIFPGSSIPDQYLSQVRMRMEMMSDVTGGRILFPLRLDEIVDLYRQLGQELGVSYSLGYVSTNKRADGTFRRVEVRTKDGRLKVSQSRTGYVSH